MRHSQIGLKCMTAANPSILSMPRFIPSPISPLQGIEVKMITGDHLLIGKETAKMLGMGTEMYPSEVLISVGLEIGT